MIGLFPIADIFHSDKRPQKHGWCPGHYCCKCRNCGKQFTGDKCCWNCADCAYDFDDDLSYETLWKSYGWASTALYWSRKHKHLLGGGKI